MVYLTIYCDESLNLTVIKTTLYIIIQISAYNN